MYMKWTKRSEHLAFLKSKRYGEDRSPPRRRSPLKRVD